MAENVSMDSIRQQISKLDGFSKWLGRREIQELPKILWEDETVKNIVQGTYNNGSGILVATDRRLIFIDKGMMWGLKVEDFDYSKITSIQYKTGLLCGQITIYASGNKAEIMNILKDQCRTFCDNVRNLIDSRSTPKQAPSNGEDDYISKLEKLAKLKEQGILTEEEFQTQKTRLLGI